VDVKYYSVFEDRKPYRPTRFSDSKDLLFNVVAIIFIFIGVDYLVWRWQHSINWDAAWVSLPLYFAEVMAFIGSLLTIINYWTHKDIPKEKPVRYLSEIKDLQENEPDRPLKIDLYIATYNEEAEIVEDTIRDATRVKYPYDDVEIRIYVLDDGHRDGSDPAKENFKALAEKYGVHYITRPDNIGFKAGNLNNAFYQTEGDIIVILDADTRIFPGFLINTTGYFRNKKMAWVQTPQWFYDIPEGVPLNEYLKIRYGKRGRFLSFFIPFSKHYTVGKNVFGTDPELFYDVILRRRNAANAAFSCGAGSLQRREALAELAVREQNEAVRKELKKQLKKNPRADKKKLEAEIRSRTPLRPFVHHISEDIFTSILLHSDRKKWQSYQHPDVEAKMLSPQSFGVFIKQFSRYAEGTLDITFSKYNPLFIKGLSLRQRLAYLETIWSYLSPFWLVIFIFYPVLFFFTLVPPLKAFSFDFFVRIVPFLMLNVVLTTIGNWGKDTKRPEQFYQAGFWYKLMALYKVLFKKNIKFNVTSKKIKYSSSNLRYTWPHYFFFISAFAGILYNIYLMYRDLHPSWSAFAANIFWITYTVYLISPYVRASKWDEKLFHASVNHYLRKKTKS
jgi:cellulose synthase (UDP-forming)